MKNNSLPKEIESLIAYFKEFPGIGRKGAEKMVFSLLKWKPEKLLSFGSEIASLPEKIKKCSICFNISDQEICSICSSSERDPSLICIVEDFTQIPLLEAAHFQGLYFVLEGKLSPLEGRTPDSLKMSRLVSRIKNTNVKEVIIAVSQDIEGQATSIYIAQLLKDFDIKITTLARGIPAGADISFANAATLTAAIQGRIKL